MIFTRIKRGASRTSVLMGSKLDSLRESGRSVLTAGYRISSQKAPYLRAGRGIRTTSIGMAAVLTAVMPALPFQVEHTQAAGISVVSGEAGAEPPLPYTIALDPQAVKAIGIDTSIQTSAITVATDSLANVQVGTSIQTEQDEEAERQRQAEAKKQQEALAAAKAAKAKAAAQLAATQQAVASVPENPGGDVAQTIIKWAGAYGVDSNWMLRVARCESGLTPTSVNHNYWAGGGNPSGVFQFLPQTFYANARRAGIANPNLWSVDNQAQTAAYMFSIGQAGQWACR